jgi:GNAT superfamily N-acetyltransferase
MTQAPQQHDQPPPPTQAAIPSDEVVRLSNGHSVCLRPLRPEDAERLLALFGRLSAESVRRRFLAPTKELDAAEARRLAAVDHWDQEALAAVGDCTANDPIVAVARYARTDGEQAEVAFVVEDAYQHLGLGHLLFKRLAGIAAARGITELYGETLPDNEPMLHLLRSTRYPLRMAFAGQLITFRLRLTEP